MARVYSLTLSLSYAVLGTALFLNSAHAVAADIFATPARIEAGAAVTDAIPKNALSSMGLAAPRQPISAANDTLPAKTPDSDGTTVSETTVHIPAARALRPAISESVSAPLLSPSAQNGTTGDTAAATDTPPQALPQHALTIKKTETLPAQADIGKTQPAKSSTATETAAEATTGAVAETAADNADAADPEQPAEAPVVQTVEPLDIAEETAPDEPTLGGQRLEDSDFLSALAAFRARKTEQLDNYVPKTRRHPLGAYVEMWSWINKARRDPSNGSVQKILLRFIEKHKGEYVAERAATDLARVAGKSGNGTLFYTLYRKIDWNRRENDLLCYKAAFDLKAGIKGALTHAKNTLRDAAGPQVEACRDLGTLVLEKDPAWAFSRLLILTQQKRFKLARDVVSSANAAQLPAARKALLLMYEKPSTWYKQSKKSFSRLPARLMLLAAIRFAPNDTEKATEIAEFAQKKISRPLRAVMWGRIAYEASLRHDPESGKLFARAGNLLGGSQLTVSPSQLLIWQARTALRDGSWSKVEAAINKLPPEQQKEPNWTYWKARALLARGQSKRARTLLSSLTKNTEFYGLLACDLLGKPYRTDAISLKNPLSASQKKAFADNPSVNRALRFYENNLIYEGNREWNWAMRGMDDSTRLLLSEYAKSLGITHRSINTSQSTKSVIFSQLYPLAHEQSIRSAATMAGLPAPWVFGLIRQESRFVSVAKSSVGAQGLMQVMPRTARWVAQHLAMKGYRDGHLTKLDTNLTLGTQYLKLVRDNFEGNVVLATAAYNAGPARAMQWRATLPRTTEAAVFAETIPFGETRDYVMKVTANTAHYSRYEKKPIRLSDLLKPIKPEPVSAFELP